MQHAMILVRATWDDEGSVWVATSADVPGLTTEAATLEGLRGKLAAMIPELLEANGIVWEQAEIPVHILADQTTRIPNTPAVAA